jgi:AcrR family transcriptional regulator
VDTEASTDQRVWTAALELFAAKGFAATGIREIAVRAGVSSAALYHYMGTKDDLLVKMLRAGMGDVVGGGERIAASLSAPDERIAALVQFHVQFHAIRQLETTVLDIELRALAGKLRDEIIALRDRYEALWTAALQEGIDEGIFHDVDAHDARLALIEMCTGVATWFSPTGRRTPEELGRRFADMALALLDARRDGQRVRIAKMDLPDPSWFRELAVAPSVPPVTAAG